MNIRAHFSRKMLSIFAAITMPTSFFSGGPLLSAAVFSPQSGSDIMEAFSKCNDLSATGNCSQNDFGPINLWNVSGMTAINWIFERNRDFDQDISKWDVSRVTDMNGMFGYAKSFNGTISEWNVWTVTDMSLMFLQAASFNQDISKWDTSRVTKTVGSFRGATAFNQDISNWNFTSVEDISFMFYEARAFDQDISKWDTSRVTKMVGSFRGATAFNQDISNWNCMNVEDMSEMFYGASVFNQDISQWDTSRVTKMTQMFFKATAFNNDISTWNVLRVTNMVEMFYGATAFNYVLCDAWVQSKATRARMFAESPGSTCVNDKPRTSVSTIVIATVVALVVVLGITITVVIGRKKRFHKHELPPGIPASQLPHPLPPHTTVSNNSMVQSDMSSLPFTSFLANNDVQAHASQLHASVPTSVSSCKSVFPVHLIGSNGVGAHTPPDTLGAQVPPVLSPTAIMLKEPMGESCENKSFETPVHADASSPRVRVSLQSHPGSQVPVSPNEAAILSPLNASIVSLAAAGASAGTTVNLISSHRGVAQVPDQTLVLPTDPAIPSPLNASLTNLASIGSSAVPMSWHVSKDSDSMPVTTVSPASPGHTLLMHASNSKAAIVPMRSTDSLVLPTATTVLPPIQYQVANQIVPMNKRTFASSNYKRFYVEATPAYFQHDLLAAVNNLLQSYAFRINASLDANDIKEGVRMSMVKIQDDAFNYGDVLKHDVSAVAEYLWTSPRKHAIVNGMQLCNVLNAVIRDDVVNEIKVATIICRSINTRRVNRENAGPNVDIQSFPPDGETWRGGGFREEHRAFFNTIKGKKFRVPAFLATSKNRSIAAGFVFKASKSHPCAIWCIKFDKRGKDHPEYRVRHMTFVSKTLVPDEEEYLFAPYSVFTLQKVKWSSKLSKPHEFTILAAVDNKEEDENLPLAPWY